MNHRDAEAQRDPLSEAVIGLGIDVHRALGPGLLESAYEQCLCYELEQKRFPFKRQVAPPVTYKDIRLECGYRLDIVVEQRLVVELKTVERILPVHKAQLLTYLKLGCYPVGLILNFHTAVLKDGIVKLVA